LPAIDAHDGVIEIDTCLTEQMTFDTKINIECSVDQAGRINPDTLFSAEPNTYNACNYSNEFDGACVNQTVIEGLV